MLSCKGPSIYFGNKESTSICIAALRGVSLCCSSHTTRFKSLRIVTRHCWRCLFGNSSDRWCHLSPNREPVLQPIFVYQPLLLCCLPTWVIPANRLDILPVTR